MNHRARLLLTSFLLTSGMLACSAGAIQTPPANTEDAATSMDASAVDAGYADATPIDAAAMDAEPLPSDKAARCASTFGDALTNSFGRLDGTIWAVVPPKHPTCAMQNGTHLVLQVLTNGKVYRMVVNLRSTQGTDLRPQFLALDHPLEGGSFAEGWHPNASLDYAKTLGLKSDAFAPLDFDPLWMTVADALPLGAKVSVFAHSVDRVESAHKIHRNSKSQDGAIVVQEPNKSPKYLVFHFAEQVF
jgi:hypothetical protein